MAFNTIFQQISILAILALVGVTAMRSGIFQDNARQVLEKLVFYITLPLLIITKLSVLEITPLILRNGLWVVISTYSILFAQVILGRLSARLLRLPEGQAVIHALHTFLGNIVFLGFPLLDALFPGGEAILYAALYQLAMNTVFWSYGIMRLDPVSHREGWRNLRKLLNPNTIALIAAMTMLLFGIRLPEMIQTALGGLGGTTLYLAMIYIGILLSTSNLFEMMRKKDVLILCLNKLLLMPGLIILAFMAIWHITGFRMNDVPLSVVVLEASMPCMTILVLLARHYGADERKAMENFVVSTVLSIASIPTVIYMLHVFMGT